MFDDEEEGSRSVTQAADNTSNPSEKSTRSKRLTSPTSAHLECGLLAQSVTVLAANLEGFEAAVLEQAREAVVRGVGETVRFVHEAAAAHKGVVQLYHGDHFVVTYNAVTPCAAHARRGVSTAQQLATGAQAIGLKLGLRAGVATGKCLVGNLGSAEAKAFNTIGAAFTQAGLLERLARQYGTGCRVLATRRTLTDVATHFRYRYVDIVPLPQVATLVGAVLGPNVLSEGEADRSGEWLYVIGSAAASTDDAINDAFCSLADGREAAFAAIMQDRLRDVDVNGVKDGIVCRLLTHVPA